MTDAPEDRLHPFEDLAGELGLLGGQLALVLGVLRLQLDVGLLELLHPPLQGLVGDDAGLLLPLDVLLHLLHLALSSVQGLLAALEEPLEAALGAAAVFGLHQRALQIDHRDLRLGEDLGGDAGDQQSSQEGQGVSS